MEKAETAAKHAGAGSDSRLLVLDERDNVVVVQRVRGNVEEGQYLYNPISSFMPRSGVDGFEFFGTSKDGATDFRRTVGAPTR